MTGDQQPDDGFLIPETLRSQILATALETSLLSAPDWHDAPGTRKPVPYRTRLRWKLAGWRERAAELAYRMVSGHDVPEREW